MGGRVPWREDAVAFCDVVKLKDHSRPIGLSASAMFTSASTWVRAAATCLCVLDTPMLIAECQGDPAPPS
jgi:predicted RNase H-like nuclease